MKKWEDIIKDRLEGYESPLPEGSLAEFRALREGGKAPRRKRVAPLVWAVSTAAAAGLAAILFLRQPKEPQEGIRIIEHPSVTAAAEPAASVPDSVDTGDLPQPMPLIAQAVVPKPVQKIVVPPQAPEQEPAQEPVQEPAQEPADEPADVEPTEPAAPAAAEPGITSVPLFAADEPDYRSALVKVAPAAGVIAGGGVLAAVVAPVLGGGVLMDEAVSAPQGPLYGEDIPMDGLVNTRHAFPLRIGLSTRIPVTDRLYVSTGLEYARYQSFFAYSLSGEKKQVAQYLEVPIRADWLVASGRLLDVYMGAGVQGDVCLGATLAGHSIRKDGPGLSLVGAGGVQLNMTKRLGLYVEPTLSWRALAANRVLQTYRSENPLLFTVGAGLRINLDK